MRESSTLVVSNSELDNHDLIEDIEKFDVIKCHISELDSKVIKKSWKRYSRYATAHVNYPSKLSTFFLAISWLFNQAYLDVKYPSLSQLTALYVSKSAKLLPVEFVRENNGITICFRKKK